MAEEISAACEGCTAHLDAQSAGGGIDRRELLKRGGIAAAAALLLRVPVRAPLTAHDLFHFPLPLRPRRTRPATPPCCPSA